MRFSRGPITLAAALLAVSCHLAGDVHDRTFVEEGGCTSDSECPSGGCQTAVCAQGVCGVTNLPSKQACSDGVCDGSGSCVACLDNNDCPSGPCQNRLCVAERCVDGLQNGAETDVDCGGGCAPCASGKGCVLADDCAGGLCESFVCAACVNQDSCADGFYCDTDGGQCLPRKPLNSSCEESHECLKPYECKETKVCDD